MKYTLRNPVTAKQWHAGDKLILGMLEDYQKAVPAWLLKEGDTVVGRVNDGDWVVEFGHGVRRVVPGEVFDVLFASSS